MLVVVDLQSVLSVSVSFAVLICVGVCFRLSLPLSHPISALCLCPCLGLCRCLFVDIFLPLPHSLCAGSEMSGGVRNVTYRNSRLGGGAQSRGIDIKPSVGRGGFMMDMSFENIHVPKNINFGSDSRTT